eukprot:TRINITY_DN1543_c0_g1_i2.p1 TRINITY_DN1543_c0_g1~~TRINITY_DN1543_c0_g1_i2.p1  ORF type:complete len:1049 (-),score=333.48 TRINITY_DN1543_c0_g1_i2:1964-5110(-)
MKDRLNGFDLALIVNELRAKLTSARFMNFHEIDRKTFTISLSLNEIKYKINIKFGQGLWITEFERKVKPFPSSVAQQIRKYLTNHRIVNIYQSGFDRTVIFTFSVANETHYLIIELYGSGNIVLTDTSGKVISAFRHHKNSESPLVLGEAYPSELFQKMEDLKGDEFLTKLKNNIVNVVQQKRKKKRRKGICQGSILELLCDSFPFPPETFEHSLAEVGVAVDATNLDELLTDDFSNQICCQMNQLLNLSSNDLIPALEGFIIVKDIPLDEFSVEDHELNGQIVKGLQSKQIKSIVDLLRECPIIDAGKILLQKHYKCLESEENFIILFPSLNEVADVLFSLADELKEKDKLKARVEALMKKPLETKENLKRIENEMLQIIDKFIVEGKICVDYDIVIDYILNMAKTLKSKSLNPDVIRSVIQDAHSAAEVYNPLDSIVDLLVVDFDLNTSNPFLELILPLPFDRLPKNYEPNEIFNANVPDELGFVGRWCRGEFDTDYLVNIKIPLEIANSKIYASNLFDEAKKMEAKLDKAKLAHEKHIKHQEQQVLQAIDSIDPRLNVERNRKVFWFEKFRWFIASTGHLVVAGRELHQNELLVSKYLDDDDTFLHTSAAGSPATIIKPGRNPIDSNTLVEAASFCLSLSRAWKNNVVDDVYWVYGKQVSKSAPNGQYLARGSFMIYGKRNFVRGASLNMGLTFLFMLDDLSVIRKISDSKTKAETEREVNKENVDVWEMLDDVTTIVTSEKNKSENIHFVTPEGDHLLTQFQLERMEREAKARKAIEESDNISTVSSTSHISNDDLLSQISCADNPDINEVIEQKNTRHKKKRVRDRKNIRRYAEQDEEDRILMESLLHEKQTREKEMVEEDISNEDLPFLQTVHVCFNCGMSGHIASECKQPKFSASDRKKFLREEEKLFAENMLNDASILPSISGITSEDISYLDTLTDSPTNEDTIIAGLLMLAPYDTIRKNRFKVRLTPGKMKQSEVIGEIQQVFKKSENADDSFVALLKSLKQTDWNNAMIAGCKLHQQNKNKNKGKTWGKKKNKQKKK